MRVLLISDDEWHPCKIPMDGTAFLREKGFTVDNVTNTENFNVEILKNYNVIIMCKEDHISQSNTGSWKNEAVQKAFVEFVENGGGLLVSHSGICAGENTELLDKLAGVCFKYHPNTCPVLVETLKPHPVTNGVEFFCEPDEHYQVEIITDDIEILSASYSAAQGDESKYNSEPYHNCRARIEPCVLVRTQGKGRVCVITPGHTAEMWKNEQFKRLLENALNWCGKEGC